MRNARLATRNTKKKTEGKMYQYIKTFSKPYETSTNRNAHTIINNAIFAATVMIAPEDRV
jgi:hypothetical protein